MIVFPAVDLLGEKAVRLLKGDYDRVTVYNDHPWEVGEAFARAGAEWIHLVDLDGAKTGTMPNLNCALKIRKASGLRCEIGGGIRSREAVDRCLGEGMDRVILGTAAVENRSFTEDCVRAYGERIAVGVDIRDGFVAVKGWTEKSDRDFRGFCREMADIGVRTLIVTDISRDGAMRGTNRELYRKLKEDLPELDIVASGGVSTLEDIRELRKMDLYGAIVGKAYYTGAIKLEEAIEEAR